MESWFVRPEITTLHVGGQTVKIRTRLSNGDRRARLSRLYRAQPSGALRVDPMQVGMATVTAYLLDWSLVDPDGQPVPIRGISVDDLTTILDDLDPDRFAAILDAIEQHELALLKERDDLKKTLAGAPTSPPISSSPAAADGGTNGSAN